MGFAKGRTDCRAERDLLLQSFDDLIEELALARKYQEITIKADLYDIHQDSQMDLEEKKSASKEYLDTLEDINERSIRIRRIIMIGLYCVFESSLKDIADYYNVLVEKGDAQKLSNQRKNIKKDSGAKNGRNNKKSDPGVSDYLHNFYNGFEEEYPEIIDPNLRELRNYMVHSSAPQSRIELIDKFRESHPEFNLIRSGKKFYFKTDNGIKLVKNLLFNELDEIESIISHEVYPKYQ